MLSEAKALPPTNKLQGVRGEVNETRSCQNGTPQRSNPNRMIWAEIEGDKDGD